MMKRSFFRYFMVFMLFLGLLSVTSCKRNKVTDPDVQGPAGFRIILSGTANPSTLYVPRTEPAVFSHITVTALNNNGTPAANKDVIFQENGYGYFENYEISTVRKTDASGVVNMTYFIPPGASIKAELLARVYITLVDDGRLDSSSGQIFDSIPILVIPYMTEGVVLHGHVLTPAGNGVGEVTVELLGEDDNVSGVTVTRSSGSYEFYVPGGWYGSIQPTHESYSFTPEAYTFTSANPVYSDRDGLDFVAIFAGGNTLMTDISTWAVGAEGGSTMINVINGTGDATIGYIVVPNNEWLHVMPSSGSTPGSFQIDADPNTTGLDRDGTILISAIDTVSASVTITVNQSSTDVSGDSTIAVDRSHFDVPNYGIGSAAAEWFTVYNSGSADPLNFSVTRSADWIIPGSTNGVTDVVMLFSVSPNTGIERSGYLLMTPIDSGVSNPNGVKVTITQDAGPSLAVDIASKSVGAAGEIFNVWISNPTDGSVPLSYTLTNADTWLKANPEIGSVPAQITIDVNPNATGVSRTAVLFINATWTTTTWGDVDIEAKVTITQSE
jgi:hypothetical protein